MRNKYLLVILVLSFLLSSCCKSKVVEYKLDSNLLKLPIAYSNSPRYSYFPLEEHERVFYRNQNAGIIMICKTSQKMRLEEDSVGIRNRFIISLKIYDIIYKSENVDAKTGDIIDYHCDYSVKYRNDGSKYFIIEDDLVPVKGDAFYLLYATKNIDKLSDGYGFYNVDERKALILYDDDEDMQKDQIKHNQTYYTFRDEALKKYADRIEKINPNNKT